LTGALEITGNGDLLNLRAPVNGNIVRMTFSSNVPDTQVGHIQYTHGNTASYGSGEAFYIGGTESTTTILADGKLMFKEGIYSKPATGTGAGTRKDSNWDTAYGWGNHASAGYTSNVGDITGVTAGTGLTGGGTSGTVTLNVIGGSGITANANDIAVDSTVFRSTGGTMTGNLTMGANHIFMTNSNIYGVNSISINDPGEGIVFQGTTNITLAAIDDATDSIMNFSNASQLQINGQRAFADNYHPNADKWTTARTNTVTLTGDVTGSGNASVDGTGNWTVSIPAVVANNSHSHSNYLPLAGGTLTGATTINAGLSINRSSTSGALWFGTQNDKNHVLWNAYYGTDPVTRGNANTGFDGIYWNAYRGIHIRGGTHGANNIIVAENSSGSANDHTVKLYASNVKRFETTTTGAVIESTLLLGSYSDSAKQGKLILGGNSANKQAEIKCTNGNLHIDSENTSATYLNYYEGTAGVAFGTGAGGVAAWMGPDGDLWKSSSDNTGSRYFNDGYHPNADKWTTARTLTLNGDVTGSVSWDGSGNATLTTAVGNNSHSHTNYLPLAGGRMTGVFNLDDQKIQFGSGSNSGSTFGNNHYSMGVDIANGGWSGSNYSDLIIGYHTGVRIGGGYSGVRFYNNSPTTDTNNTGNGNGGEALLMTIGGGGSTTSGANVTINNDLYMGDNIHINAGKGFDNSGGWTRNQTPHGYIEFGPANASHAHIYTDRPNFYFNKDLYVNNQRVFHVGYHPNADKWTTARTNTVTLTGDVTGSGNASVDGTGNWTVSIPAVVANNSHSHSNYLTSNAADTATGKITFNAGFDGNSIFLNGAQNFDALKTSGFYSLYNATATGHTNAPFQYGAMISANNTAASGGMGMQLAHERTGAGTFIRGMNDSSDTWYAWQRIFMDNYHPNADKWTTLRTLFLTGDVTGSVNWDGSGNATMTTTVGNDSHSHSNYLPIAGKAADSNLLDGIDSNRVIFGTNTSKVYRWDGDWNTMFTTVNTGFIDNASGTNGNPDGFTHHHGFQVRHDNMGNQWGFQFMGSYHPSYKSLYHRSVNAGTWSSWKEIWDSGNDGSGSGLDADLLDGQHGSYYATNSSLGNYLPLAGGRMTGMFNLDDQKIQFGSGGNSGTTFGANHYSMGVDIANGGWSGTNYSDLIIGYHTGVRIGGGYSGVRFYNNSPTTDTNNTGNGNGGEALLMTIGGGGSSTSGTNVTVNNSLIVGGVIDANGGHGGINITNSSILSSATSTWTGNPGAAGKIQYHSNRWYIVSDSSSNKIVQFRRDGSDKSYIDNNGALIGGGNWYSGNDGSGSGLDADTVDGIQGASFLRSDAVDTIGARLTMGLQHALVPADYGIGVTGLYSSTRYQHVWSMGSAYGTNSSGTSYGNMYGLTYTHTNVGTGTNQAISGLSHQLQHRTNGVLTAAIGSGIWTSGNVTAYSDIAVKTNLVKIPNALEKVCSINGYTYERTDYVKDLEDPEAPDVLRQAGVVAQEVEKILPEVVSGKDGNKAVAYGNMVALMIEAIKELKDEVDELKAQLKNK
jgi:hypothetical protein